MSTLSRRRFLVLTGAGVVAVAAGGVALAVRQLTGSGQKSMLIESTKNRLIIV